MSKNEEILVRSATNDDCENVQELVFSVLREYGLEPAPEGIDKDISDIEAHYINRGGLFELLESTSGSLLGTVGLYPFDEKRIELRKMYFSRELRGKGMGKITLGRMIDFAKEKNYDQLILETASSMIQAIGLYKAFGFAESVDKHVPRCDKSFFLNLR